ncbi:MULTISPECIES: zf-TFIIB domain-containing protein [unclassified Crossiella]|uniref:TFIIB-type zinc ribbon-containing protein n=1 Tax=unclassified Crossiella TaxID=2620835 RepID=UPI0027E58F1F|nr:MULTISPECIES: zf-TFIIB domain-containing protein [unclassified Crossiella]
MICPKCQNVMQTVDRGGVHIEQCQGCRGIFLDRGELEQIAGAERTYYAAAPVPPPPPPMPGYRHDSPPPYGHRGSHGHRDSPPPYGGHRPGHRDSPPPYGGHGYGHKRKKSFLEGLFD